MQEFFLGRQPIVDRRQQLVGYELLFRSNMQNAAQVASDLSATATVIAHAFGELGLQNALGSGLGFINADASLLFSDALALLPRDRVVLEILETVPITPALIERLKELKQAGYILAVDDLDPQTCPRYRDIMHLLDYVKVDVARMSQVELLQTTKFLRSFPVKLLAEKLETIEQADFCKTLGYDFFQGYYFARPTILKGKKIAGSQLALLRLLELTLREADTSELEKVIKPEPGLILNLLRTVNSVGVIGMGRKITSLREAITVLGRRQLMRWLQLLLFAGPQGAADMNSPLLQLAATRGRVMELLAGVMPGVSKDFQDHAFMTGVLSLTPALLETTIEEILKSISVSPEIHAALVERSGTLGQLLSLTESLEDADGCAKISAVDSGLPLTSAQINRCLTEAMAWAATIGKVA